MSKKRKPPVLEGDVDKDEGVSEAQQQETLLKGSRLPAVVALSANAMPRDIEKGLEAGFFRCLTKPIRVREFMDTLDETLLFSKSISMLAREVEKI